MKLVPFQQMDLFPTRIHIAENFLDKNEFQKLNLLVKKDKQKLDIPEFELAILRHMGIICDSLGVNLGSYSDVEITDTWGNVLEPGDDHLIHTHSNHVFSGVFYLTKGNPTIFLDPRPAADFFSLNYKNSSQCFYGSRAAMPATPNTIVIFPSWLPHLVMVNREKETRKSISFNIIFRGKYGQENSLQEVTL